MAQSEAAEPRPPAQRLLPWFLWAQVIPAFILAKWVGLPAIGTIVLVVVAAWQIGRDRDESIGLLGLSVPGAGGMRTAALLMLPTLIWPRLVAVPFQSAFPDAGPVYPGMGLWLAALTIVIVPVMEEILYRGVLLNALRPWGRVPAILAGSILFGLGHGPALFVSTVMVGWVLGWLAWEYGSIWPGVLVHAGFNLVAGFSAWLMETLTYEMHMPLLLALLALLAGGALVMTVRERVLLRRVILEPWRDRSEPAPSGPWRQVGRILLRVWPVTVMVVISLLGWIMLYTPVLQTIETSQ